MPNNHETTKHPESQHSEHLLAAVSLRAMLAAIAAGGALAASICGLVGSADAATPPTTGAAPSTSTAYGAAATGADPVSPSPTVSSSGAIKTGSGDVSSPAGTFTASGISVRAGAGIAESRVSSLTVAGETFGPISTTCRDGVTKVAHNGEKATSKNLSVAYGSGGGPKAVGITVTITGAGEQDAQTITAAVAQCGKGSPPSDGESPNPAPGDRPGGTDEASQPGGSDNAADRSSDHGSAPAPRLHIGHHPVTG